MKVIICGGRDYTDQTTGFKALDEIHAELNITHVIQGGARGADSIGAAWALERGIKCTAVLADWDRWGKSAGYRRNLDMANMKPDMVLAFPGGRGTQHMINIAMLRNIPVRQYET